MITKELVEEKLKLVSYPGFTKSIVDFGFVKSIDIDKESVSVLVDISSSAPEVKRSLSVIKVIKIAIH
jgi:ATP-binding protein involved in chromosome partitioning